MSLADPSLGPQVKRFGVSTIEPERPRIKRANYQAAVLSPGVTSEPRTHRRLVLAFDEMRGAVPGADRPPRR